MAELNQSFLYGETINGSFVDQSGSLSGSLVDGKTIGELIEGGTEDGIRKINSTDKDDSSKKKFTIILFVITGFFCWAATSYMIYNKYKRDSTSWTIDNA